MERTDVRRYNAYSDCRGRVDSVMTKVISIRITIISWFCLWILGVLLAGAHAQDLTRPPSCAGPGVKLAIHNLARGAIGNLTEKREQVIHAAGEWEALWKELGLPLNPAPTSPSIDFKTDMVIAVASGTGRGIVEVAISEVEQRTGCLHVTVFERTLPPALAGMQISALRPFHIIRLSSVSGPVVFEYSATTEALKDQ
jgi:hypothetical protein